MNPDTAQLLISLVGLTGGLIIVWLVFETVTGGSDGPPDEGK